MTWQAWVVSDAAFALFPRETQLPDTAKLWETQVTWVQGFWSTVPVPCIHELPDTTSMDFQR